MSNQVPTLVNAGPDQTVNEGTSVSFTGSFSDPDSGSHTFRWEVTASNGQQVAGGTAQNFSFVPNDEGTYTVVFTVTDDAGASASDTAVVTVNNVAPTLSLTGNASVNEGTSYQLGLSASDLGNDTIQYWTINWGDGSAPEQVMGGQQVATHVYDTPGSYTITATATDEDGTWTAPAKELQVNNVAPAISLTVYKLGQRYVRIVGNITDTHPAWLIVAFDGVINHSVVTDANGNFEFVAEASGLGDFTARVTDDYGATGETTMTITSEPPRITSFVATQEDGDIWTFSGCIVDESPGGLMVQFGGIPSLENVQVMVEDDGTFSITLTLAHGESGLATAVLTDWWGLTSNTAMTFVDNIY